MKRWAKALFYNLASPIMRLNSLKYKFVKKRPNSNLIKLHLGPGKKTIYQDG